MRHRITTRIAVASTALLSIAIGTVAPATAAPPGPAGRPQVGLAIDVLADGAGPFSPDDRPGGDIGPTNGVVRTLDSVTYRVTVNANGGVGHRQRFTVTAPTGTSWAALPAGCSASGSGIDGRDLTCVLGDVAEGQVVAVSVVLDVSTGLDDGDAVIVTGTATADDADTPVSATAPRLTVSAAARYNLSKRVVGSVLRPDVTGPDGTRGFQLVFPIAVDWQPVVPGQGLLGFAPGDGRMTFTDDVSQLRGDLPSGAVLWNGDAPPCGPNDPSVSSRFASLPAGSGGGPRAVADSGRFTCEQSGAGQDVSVTITGTVTDASRMPTQNAFGGPVVGNTPGFVVSGYISFWVPNPPAGTSLGSVNTFRDVLTHAASGTPNFPGDAEPVADNRATRNIVADAVGTAGKRLLRVLDDSGRTGDGSARRGDPWSTPGSVLRSDVSASNPGLDTFRNTVLCDTFDRHTQRLTRVQGTSARTSGLREARVEYAAYDMDGPEDGQRRATCDDDRGPWFTDPAEVPGGIDAVGAVRARGDVVGGTAAALSSFVSVREVADGTRAYDFGHVRFSDRHPDWVHDTRSDPELGAGGLSDSVLVTEDLARIGKTVALASSSSATAGDMDTPVPVVPGNAVDYVLTPSLTNGNTTGRPRLVTVRDVLPAHMAYSPGSASVEPAVDTVRDDDGIEHQRLTWAIDDVTPNTRIAPIRYTAVVARDAPAGPLENRVEVSAPTDRSPSEYRSAARAVQVVTSGGLRVEKRAEAPVVVTGDDLVWSLDTTNTDTDPVRDVQLVDVLPHAGDGSSFHGGVELARPVEAGPAESVVYTAADPEAVSLDPADESNQPGGSTTWCAETAFGSAGCPDTLADVTAIRIDDPNGIAPGETVSHRVSIATHGQRDGDRYTNRFGVRSADLALPVRSNPATVRVVSGAVGDLVWTDSDGNGVQDPDEPGIPDVPVRLHGTDDRGREVDRVARTDREGHYLVDDLRPGDYVVSVAPVPDRAFTIPSVGDDDARDSDVAADGRTAPITITRRTGPDGALEGVERNDRIDAGVLPSSSPEPGDGAGSGGPGSGGPGDGGSGDGGPGSSGSTGSGPDDHADATAHPGGSTGHALAFTGAVGTAAAAISAFLLLMAGLGLRAVARARRRV
ncbi:hypothetical protein DEJ33_13560 [Curtobacterium sp. MCPF17_047]|uniref:SdrD B-like domain-containing protein n=1 Tax=Curtobacterium sp. MCPF17_047 TaxID=2175654 RepID=UPI000DA7624B|nr:SdrD B-like domain-containing protein [Curtobacterium sp. MCPF17_047]PZF63637.1 hypothetical protein DEJ33_13560 [Curtobacterium sp. MCPF17_047]